MRGVLWKEYSNYSEANVLTTNTLLSQTYSCFKLMYNVITLTCREKKKKKGETTKKVHSLKIKKEEHEKRGNFTMHLMNC